MIKRGKRGSLKGTTHIIDARGCKIKMTDQTISYIPALRFHWLTPLYDPVLKWGMPEEHFKRQLIAQATLAPYM